MKKFFFNLCVLLGMPVLASAQINITNMTVVSTLNPTSRVWVIEYSNAAWRSRAMVWTNLLATAALRPEVTNAISSLGVTNFFATNSGAGRYVRVNTKPAANLSGANLSAMEFWSDGSAVLETNTPFLFLTLGYDPVSNDGLQGQLIFRGTSNHGDTNGTQAYGDIGGIHFEKANMTAEADHRLFVLRVRDPVAGGGDGGGYVSLLSRLTNGSGAYNEFLTANENGHVSLGQFGQGGIFLGHISIPADPGTPVVPSIYLQHKTLIANPRWDGIENDGVHLFFTQKVSGVTNRFALASFNDVTNLFRLTNSPGFTGTGSTNFIVDCSQGNVFECFPTANFKIFFTNTYHGFQGWINIVQDGTGSRTMLYNAPNIKTNASLVLSTPANTVDRIDIRTDSTGTNGQFILQKAFQ